jgi:hypothetical protein
MDQFLAAAQEKGVLSHDEVAAWLAELEEADRCGQLTFTGTIFTVSGTK